MKEAFEKIKERLQEYIEEYSDLDENGLHSERWCAMQEALASVNQVAEEYNQGWIPCSEKLPDVPEGIEDSECPEFNVTIKGAEVATTLKYAPDGTWFDDDGEIYGVIAWQPLPELYSPKGE